MTGKRESVEQFNPPSDWQELAQENGSLRTIIAELLIKNQKLRWSRELAKGKPLCLIKFSILREICGSPLRSLWFP